MSTRLHELEKLTFSENATFSLTIRKGVSRASFKIPGRRAEVVADLLKAGRPPDPVESILAELLDRMNYSLDVQTYDHIVQLASPRQLTRMRELIAELQLIKAQITQKHAWEARQVEPRLAPPRSSLHPQLVQGAPE